MGLGVWRAEAVSSCEAAEKNEPNGKKCSAAGNLYIIVTAAIRCTRGARLCGVPMPVLVAEGEYPLGQTFNETHHPGLAGGFLSVEKSPCEARVAGNQRPCGV